MHNAGVRFMDAMTAQLDMFATPAPAPRPAPPATTTAKAPTAELIPPPPTVQWARLLARHMDVSTRVMVQCSSLYTGIVLEVLALGTQGQHWLMKDHTIRENSTNLGVRSRIIYVTPRQAIAMHARHPMIMTTKGSHCCSYRLADPGEAAPAELPLPPATIGPEVG